MRLALVASVLVGSAAAGALPELLAFHGDGRATLYSLGQPVCPDLPLVIDVSPGLGPEPGAVGWTLRYVVQDPCHAADRTFEGAQGTPLTGFDWRRENPCIVETVHLGPTWGETPLEHRLATREPSPCLLMPVLDLALRGTVTFPPGPSWGARVPLVAVAPAVRQRFPGLELRCAVLAGLANGKGRVDPAGIAAQVGATRTLDGLKDDPLFRAHRDFFWEVGIDPTKVRPSGEALNRRVLAGKPLPRINDLVDAYNLASLRTGVPIAAFDADTLEDAVELRFARPGEGFVSIGADKRETLQGKELVMADAGRVIAFYPHRDSDATKVTEATKACLLVACGAPGVAAKQLDEALALAVEGVRAACGGEVRARD